jgi:hypothetical protein
MDGGRFNGLNGASFENLRTLSTVEGQRLNGLNDLNRTRNCGSKNSIDAFYARVQR